MKSFSLKEIFLAAILLLGVSSSKSQTVAIDGEIRPRMEYRDGMNKPLLSSSDPAIIGMQRTRLNLFFKSAVMSSQITFQDVRTFGQTPNASEVATTAIYEAWSELLLAPGTTFKVGRQALSYDDRRLFSSPRWSNTGTAHDAALLKFWLNDLQAHVGGLYNNNSAIYQESYYTPSTKYRYMGFVWLSKNIMNGLNISAIGVDEGVQDTMLIKPRNYKKVGLNHAYTYGGNLKLDVDSFPLTAMLTAYFQSGESGMGAKMRGNLLAIKMGYKVTEKLSITAGADHLSGDNNSADGIQHNFKKLYGADHYFNGSMEYWRTPINEGLRDYYGGLTGKINSKLNFETYFHLFQSDKEQTYGKVNSGRDLGSEIDLLVNYKLNEWSSVEGGWSRYFIKSNTLASKSITTGADISNPQWAYLMFTIKPTFLK